MEILVADDDIRVNEMLCDTFALEGYSVASVFNGIEAIEYLDVHRDVGLLILDVMMPQMDGWEVLEYVREHFDVKVLMLTAMGEEHDEVQGFTLGADDYVSKPFKRNVLVARAKRLIGEWEDRHNRAIGFEAVRLSPQEHKVYVEEEEIKVTEKEYQLLNLFMHNPKMVLNRNLILERVWGYDYEGNDRVIDTHIKMLRKSIGKYGEYIRTVRGVGYSLEAEVVTV